MFIGMMYVCMAYAHMDRCAYICVSVMYVCLVTCGIYVKLVYVYMVCAHVYKHMYMYDICV